MFRDANCGICDDNRHFIISRSADSLRKEKKEDIET